MSKLLDTSFRKPSSMVVMEFEESLHEVFSEGRSDSNE